MFKRRLSPGSTLRLSWLYEAISLASGEDFHSIVTPAANVQPSSESSILTLGTITYV